MFEDEERAAALQVQLNNELKDEEEKKEDLRQLIEVDDKVVEE